MLLANCASPAEGQSHPARQHQGMCCQLSQVSKCVVAAGYWISSLRESDEAILMVCNMKGAILGNILEVV